MRNGAFDFLEKPVEADCLLGAIGRAVAHDRAARGRRGAERAARARFETLTAREVDVCRLVAAGMPNKAIASQLGISIKTVKVHRGRVFQKLGVASLADLVRLAAVLPAADRSPTSSPEGG
jgi:FixJ family two-component response regulator